MINGLLKERYIKIQLDIEVLDEILEKYGADTLVLYLSYGIFENYKLSSIIKEDTVYKRYYVTDTDVIKYLRWTPRKFYRYKEKLLASGYIIENKDKITSIAYIPNGKSIEKKDNAPLTSPIVYVKGKKIKKERVISEKAQKQSKALKEHIEKVAYYCKIHKVNYSKELSECPLCKLDREHPKPKIKF